MSVQKTKLRLGIKLLLGALITLLALRWVPTDTPWVQDHVVEASLENISQSLPETKDHSAVVFKLSDQVTSDCPWLPELLSSKTIQGPSSKSEPRSLKVDPNADAQIHVHCEPSRSWGSLELSFKGTTEEWKQIDTKQSVPSWVALVAPVLAVVWAFLLGNALLALLLGIVVGSSILSGFSPAGTLQMAAVDQIGATLTSPTTLKILLFTSSLIGLVQMCIKSGGIEAFIHWLTRGKLSRRRTQGTTVALGTMIFFDDYANTMVVGASMQPMSDKMKISREKLAYLVDATSAPIAGIAMISTWIGMEINLFESFGEQRLTEFFGNEVTNGFSAFRVTMPFRFYCILTLLFVVMLVWSRRDYGPMLKAELKAQNAPVDEASPYDEEQSAPSTYARPIDGILPILVTLVAIVSAFMYFAQESWDAASDQMLNILPICGISGGIFALIWNHLRTGLKFPQALQAYALGVRTVAPTLAILVLAMTIQGLTDQLGTGIYLAGLVHDAPPILLPAAVFLLAGAVAFCTGSSWATMGLLVPVAVPIAHAIVETHGMTPALTLAVAGSVLDGAIFGDHCSPISDTTVMSSAATGCDHIDHVRTQVPYAMTVMIVAALVGYGFSTLVLGSPWPGYGLGALVLFGVIRVFGTKSDLS